MHDHYVEEIAPVVEMEWQKKKDTGEVDPKKSPKANFMAQVAREMFLKLPKERQEKISAKAKKEAATKKAEYEKALKDAPSKNPRDRQR